ncbi:MAG: phosphodiesterase [Burkholderiales bacterium]|nr:phosphodiesterase [Burkholderiales bacterium]
MILLQISDLHIGLPGELLSGVVDTAAALARAVDQISRLTAQPDGLLISGDLVNRGSPEEYSHLRELLAPLTMPIYVVPGNHDDRDNLRAAFADQLWLPKQGYLHYTVDDFPVRIIALDTVVPGAPGGMLDQARLGWLAERLQETHGKPTLIMMHHPPFKTGIRFMDAMGLRHGNADFVRLVARYPNVERIVCGHVHRASEARVGNSLAMTCPATCHQVSLEFDEAIGGFTLEPPGFRLHWWNGEELISHSAAIGDFPGPYRF